MNILSVKNSIKHYVLKLRYFQHRNVKCRCLKNEGCVQIFERTHEVLSEYIKKKKKKRKQFSKWTNRTICRSRTLDRSRSLAMRATWPFCRMKLQELCRLITMSENTFPKLSIAYTRTVRSNQKLEAYRTRALTLCVLSSTCNYSRGYVVTPINEYTTCERHRVE